MGIKKFTNLIPKNCFHEVTLKTFKNSRIAIDASSMIYQYLVAIRIHGENAVNSSGKNSSCIIGFLRRTTILLENGITPVYVFDGKPPEMKAGTLEKRKQIKLESQIKSELAENEEESLKFKKRSISVTKEIVDSLKSLLSFMGIQWVAAEHEAESTCVALYNQGLVDYIASEDSDTIVIGSNNSVKVIKHFTKNDTMYLMKSEEIMESLQISSEQFIDLCILCGTDYNDNIKGIGPVTALKLIREHKCLENVCESLGIDNTTFLMAREQFKCIPETFEINNSEFDENKLQEFLGVYDFDPVRINLSIAKLKKAKEINKDIRSQRKLVFKRLN